MDTLSGDNYSFFPARLVCGNLSEDSVTEVFRLPEVLRPYHISLAVISLLYLVVGLPWNLLVIITIVKEKLFMQPTIILLLNLVVTDFLTLLFYMTARTVTGFVGEIILGDSDRVSCELCRVVLIIDQALFFSVILTVVMLSFDRFFYIHKPFRYEKAISARRTLLAVAIMWGLCIAISLMYFAVLQDVFWDQLLMECNWDITESGHTYFHIFSILFLLVSYLFLLVCNVWVVVIVVKNIRTVYKVQRSSKELGQRRVSMTMLNQQMRRHRNRRQLHLMRVFGGIILANTIAWLPQAVLGVFSFLPHSVPMWYVIAASALFSSQVVVHPILESTLIKEIRVPLIRMLTCGWYGKKTHNGNIPSIADSDRRGSYAAVCCRCCHDAGGSSWCNVFHLFNAALVSHIVDNIPPSKSPNHTRNGSTGHTPPDEATTEHAHNENDKEGVETATAASVNCGHGHESMQY